MLKNIKKFFKRISRKKGKRLTICPRCGNPKIHLSSILDGWITPPQYVCDICGYTGPMVMEVDEEEFKQYLKDLSKQNAAKS